MHIDEARDLVQQFENCSLPKEKWTHEAHFVMALWYCCHQPVPEAVQSIREGIKKYNVSTGGQNTNQSGYHETITLFYTRLIIRYILSSTGDASFTGKLKALTQQSFLEKSYPLQYFSKELLMSTTARKNWVEPDIMAFL